MEKIRRPNTLSACILLLVIAAYVLISNAYGLSLLNVLSMYASLLTMVYVELIALMAASIAVIILSSILISKHRKPTYPRSMAITLIVLSFALAVYYFIALCVDGNFVRLLPIVVFVIGAIFLIIDCRKFRKSTEQTAQVSQPTQTPVMQDYIAQTSTPANNVQPSVAQYETAPVEKKQTHSLAQKLQKLNAMKSAGLINDEDFEKLKAKLIDQADIEGI